MGKNESTEIRTEEEIRGSTQSKSAACLVPVPATTKNTMLLAMHDTHTEKKCFVGHLNTM